MNKLNLLCAAMSAVVVAGCAQTMDMKDGGASAKFTPADCPDRGSQTPVGHCSGANCTIRVHVVWNGAAQTCEVLVDTLKMIVHGQRSEEVEIRWMLAGSPNWRFERAPTAPPPAFADPVIFKVPSQNPQNVFSDLKVRHNQASLVNKLVERGPFDYKIRVRTTIGGSTVILDSPDPAIFNEF